MLYFLLIFLILGVGYCSSRLLLEYPFITSHDSASGYLKDTDHFVEEQFVKYTKTQVGGIDEQLNCGARAFDYRPYVNSNETSSKVVAHHGGVVIPYEMSQTLDEILSFQQQQQEQKQKQDLVLIYVNKIEGNNCQNGNCEQAVLDVLNAKQIAYIGPDQCDMYVTLSYQDALSMTKGSNGVLAVYEPCADENYDPTITCYGFQDKTKYSCYGNRDGGDHSDIPLGALDAYIAIWSQSPPISKQLWLTQAHWQSSVESVPMGILHGSSVTLDEERSSVNSRVAGNIRSGAIKYANLLELDNVCDGGNDIYSALQEMGLFDL